MPAAWQPRTVTYASACAPRSAASTSSRPVTLRQRLKEGMSCLESRCTCVRAARSPLSGVMQTLTEGGARLRRGLEDIPEGYPPGEVLVVQHISMLLWAFGSMAHSSAASGCSRWRRMHCSSAGASERRCQHALSCMARLLHRKVCYLIVIGHALPFCTSTCVH